MPCLVDDHGVQLTPVHLGGAGHDFLPSPLKLLTQFGPGDPLLTLPPAVARQEGDLVLQDRLTLGNLVVRRKRWFLTPNPLAGRLDGLSDAAALAFIDGWRRKLGLPDRMVLIEKVHHAIRDDFYKPQYLDFTSPLFVALFRTALRENGESLTFEEVLPEPGSAPRDETGEAWVFELILDSLALRPARLSSTLELPAVWAEVAR
jgi:hypothetical protein